MPDAITSAAHHRMGLPSSVAGLPRSPCHVAGAVLWTPPETAKQMCSSISALAKGRMGIGPLATLPYVRLGSRRVAYRPADVLAWIESRMTRSTAEAKAQRGAER